MRISYNKLQKLMIDNQMKRQDLMRAAEISSSVATKLNKNETVSLDVLMRICKVFHCDIGDICEVILDEYKEHSFQSKIKWDIKRFNVHQKGELDGRRNI